MSAELFTIATQVTPGLERLQASLSKFSVPLTLLGQNEAEYWGHGWRWKTFARAAKKSAADVVIHCDVYDCICIGQLNDLLTKFAALQQPIVFGFVPQQQPEPWLALDPGLMIAEGRPSHLCLTSRHSTSFIPIISMISISFKACTRGSLRRLHSISRARCFTRLAPIPRLSFRRIQSW